MIQIVLDMYLNQHVEVIYTVVINTLSEAITGQPVVSIFTRELNARKTFQFMRSPSNWGYKYHKNSTCSYIYFSLRTNGSHLK
jgi:hypothetical protein